ncbi:MAG: hypothetical protein JXR84_19635 [Anaerolineae bacterium]|nr:hypothetical protein [Anaerolineae bacterium]
MSSSIASILPPRPLPPELDWKIVPFKPPAPVEVYKALQSFYQKRPYSTWFHPLTGLPAYLYGHLQDPLLHPTSEQLQAVETFLQEHELLLAGVTGKVRLSRISESRWKDDDTYQVIFSQTNQAGVPVYGCGIGCNLTPDELTFVANTLHPIRSSNIDSLEWPLTWLDWEEKLAPITLPGSGHRIDPQRFVSPPVLREESRKQGWPVDRWILPYLPPGETEGMYRPVWRTVITDQEGQNWLTLIDALDMQVLYIESTIVEKQVSAELFESTQDALSIAVSNKVLNYGWGNGKMANANHVHFVNPSVGNSRFVEPDDAAVPSDLRHLSATVFYHLQQAQRAFLGLGWFNWLVDAPNNTNPFQDIDVSLSDAAGSACYEAATNQIRLYAGTPNAAAPVIEPGFDCEVIYHEFTHAMNRYFNPQVFQTSTTSFTRELDEGLAFYFACAWTGNSQWAEYAYQKWIDNNNQSLRDLDQGCQCPEEARNASLSDPSGNPDQTVGLWWGKVFWAIAQHLGVNWCNRLLIKALKSLPGPLAAGRVFAQALVAHAGGHEQEVQNVLDCFCAFNS